MRYRSLKNNKHGTLAFMAEDIATYIVKFRHEVWAQRSGIISTAKEIKNILLETKYH